MKTKAVFFCVAMLAIGLLWPGTCWAGNPQTEPGKPRGLLGGLTGDTDPTKDRRPSPPAKPAETAASHPPTVVYSPPDPNRFDKRIAHLEALTPETVKPVSGLDAAQRRIDVLRRRAAKLRTDRNRRTAALTNALAQESQHLEDRWRGLIEAMNDGKERTQAEWAKQCEDLLGTPHQLELPEEVIGLLPKMDPDLEEDWDDGTDAPPEDEIDPVEPVEAPKAPAPAPDFKDLIEAFRKHNKPATMHALTWARLRDRFEYDLARFQFAAVKATKKLEAQRRDELDRVVAALRRAQDTYANLKKLGDDPGEGLRQHLAYRLYKAELEQLKLARNDLRQIAKERAGQKTKRSFVIRTDPLAPEKTLTDLARIMELSGGPAAPDPGAFDNIDPNGLPPLYPEGSDIIIDGKVHYSNLVKANIERYERMLRDINRRKANAEALVRRREQRLLRRRAAELRRQDRLDEREGHPLNEARNRRVLRQMQKELEASRAEHVAQLRTQLEAEAEAEPIIKRLEAEYKRRDVMQAAEKALQPKPLPDPVPQPNEP